MQSAFTTIVIGSVSGLHAACYGAYKDSPHEQFKPRRFFREIVLAATIAVAILLFFPTVLSSTKLLLFLVILAWSRILTEGYKLFIRVEPQDSYLIPSQVHVFRHIITNRATRLFLGLFVAGLLAFFSVLATIASRILHGPLLGALIGLTAGTATALGGGYKDGLFEGFDLLKFFRSPAVGLLSGGLLALINPIHTHTHTHTGFTVLRINRNGTHDR